MPLIKQPLNINFSSGLDLKSDPNQVPIGKFTSLENSIFTKAGLLAKRNGYGALTALPDASSTVLTTFKGGLTAIGTTLEAYSSSTQQWSSKGSLLPIDVTRTPLLRNNTSQSQCDAAVAPNGLVCSVYTDQDPTNLSNKLYRYAIYDTVTSQNVVVPTTIAEADQTYGTPRVFVLGGFFVILYTSHPASYHLRCLKISTSNPTLVQAPFDIASSYTPSTTMAFDGCVVGERLFIAYPTTSGGASVKVTYIIPSSTSPVSPATLVGGLATLMSVTADTLNPSQPIVYIAFSSAGSTSYVAAVDNNLNVILGITATTVPAHTNITSVANNGKVFVYLQVTNDYGYDAGIRTDYIESYSLFQNGSVYSAPQVVFRSIGLASKAVLVGNDAYFLAIYTSNYQPTYFLMRTSITASLNVTASIISYSNGGGYLITGLPLLNVTGSVLQAAFLRKDQIQAANTTQGASLPPVYSQLGIELASFDLGVSKITNSEIGENLNLSGGYLTAYDGTQVTEQGFYLYPDYVEAAPLTTGGSMAAQIYFYKFCYEWTDNQGNLFRSADSIAVGANVTGSGSGSVILYVPTLRLTYKLSSPVRIVGYRWSAAQQTYYQFTSITTPLLNNPAIDYVSITDTLADSAIIGNNIIYTTGGVLPNLGAHAYSNVCLFDNRIFGVDAEDRNLLRFSKQVIESVPVEMSDYLSEYIAPTTASQGSTGPITAIAPMDDKLIIYKANALGYISGQGPDNTGANNQYSNFILINSVVGCENQQSIVFTPAGLMFQSTGKGIWLLGRDLSTQYIGAPVESLTQGAVIQSAVNVPSTTQVRFTLDSGITLMYDYFYGQWGTFNNIPSISSVVYQSLHTYLDKYGRVFQETPGLYLDNSSPVLMSFTTGWINFAGLQGYERFYEMLLLGTYITPYKLSVQFGYDYNPTIRQATIVSPDNFAKNWGQDTLWGGAPTWGGTPYQGADIGATGTVFEARVFPTIQKCESFRVTVTEQFDSSKGQPAGAGLSLSGMNLMIGVVRGNRTSRASRSFG